MRSWMGVLALGMTVACSPAVQSSEAPKKGDPRDAAPQASELLEKGRAYAELGDSLRAQQYFAASLKAGASEEVVIPLLLRACIAQKNYHLAVEYAEAALSRHPKNAPLRFLTGTIHASLGDMPRARERLEQAAQDLPKDSNVQFTVAVFFRDYASDPVRADVYFRKYLELEPKGAHAEEAQASLMERIE